jgi:hypothetical protein
MWSHPAWQFIIFTASLMITGLGFYLPSLDLPDLGAWLIFVGFFGMAAGLWAVVWSHWGRKNVVAHGSMRDLPSPDRARLMRLLLELQTKWSADHFNKQEMPPVEWMNEELRRMGESWQIMLHANPNATPPSRGGVTAIKGKNLHRNQFKRFTIDGVETAIDITDSDDNVFEDFILNNITFVSPMDPKKTK